MAESSYLWSTGGAGDGSATYTRTDWSTIAKIFSSVHGASGVSPTLENALVGSVPAANTVRIGTGGALVDGKPYYNSASVDVNIPSATGGGNTRIDRVVLRANWTAQTVRITRIAGTAAASPTAPALTQTSGTTYDIPLYQALVTTGGVVTLTDERPLTTLAASEIADGAVTTSKLANDSVTVDKVGDGIVPLLGHQGGSSSNWFTTGTTDYSVGAVKMYVGSRDISINSGFTGSQTVISFPGTFASEPIVLVTMTDDSDTTPFTRYWIHAVTSANFTFQLARSSSSGNADYKVSWVAIGPA